MHQNGSPGTDKPDIRQYPSEIEPLLPKRKGSVASSYHSTPISPARTQSRPVDEETSKHHEIPGPQKPPRFAGVVACLVLGIIIANADSSLVLATFGQIGSEFDRLGDANWMVVGFMLGSLTTQPGYGKLSDIFGRKALLILAYTLFALGSLLIGLSTEFCHIIGGRIISGIGAAGMTSVVSIVLTDLLPVRELGSWRSYVYTAATVGRAIGAPLGGLMVDTIGWRWSFLGQVPLACLAIILVYNNLKIPYKRTKVPDQTLQQRLRRIDFLGGFSLAIALSFLLLFLTESGKRMTIEDPFVIAVGTGFLLFGTIFVIVEAYVAKEPVMPLRIITDRDLVPIYSVLGFTTGSQIMLVQTVSIYFVVTLGVSNANAAARLIFGNVAHAFGGLIGGILVRRTGRYKRYVIFAVALSTASLFMITLRWRGHTNIFETGYIFPAGFGIGMLNTVLFVGLSASVKPEDQAIATSAFYLCDNLGYIGVSTLGNAVLQYALHERLHVRLANVDNTSEIVHRVVGSIWTIKELPSAIRPKAVLAFVEAMQWDHGLSTVIYGISLFIAVVFLREYTLEDK